MNQTQLTKKEEIEAVMLAGMRSRIDLNKAQNPYHTGIATKEDVKTIEEEYIKEYYLPNDGTNMVIYRKKPKKVSYSFTMSQMVQLMITMALWIISAFVAGMRLTEGKHGEFILLLSFGVWGARMMMDIMKEGQTENVETQKPS